jgi:GH25 family lysozyme M1 (1,4-beta-N-acetylmuramidase)
VLEDYFLHREPSWPLWVRRTPEDPEPVLELPWQFLQYDDQHLVDGIEGEVDHDVFQGDEAALAGLRQGR